jgi:hypothetical protein
MTNWCFNRLFGEACIIKVKIVMVVWIRMKELFTLSIYFVAVSLLSGLLGPLVIFVLRLLPQDKKTWDGDHRFKCLWPLPSVFVVKTFVVAPFSSSHKRNWDTVECIVTFKTYYTTINVTFFFLVPYVWSLSSPPSLPFGGSRYHRPIFKALLGSLFH